MRRPYLTKVWCGKHWRYLHTRREYQLRVWWRFGITSYKRVRDHAAT